MKATCSLLLYLIVLVSLTGKSSAQTNERSPPKYKDFAFDGKQIVVLTNTGTLTFFDVKSRQSDTSLDIDAPVVAVTIDKKGSVVVGDTNHLIKSYDTQQKAWHVLAQFSGKLTSILFNSQNQCFLVTNKGVVDPTTDITYFPDSSFSKNRQLRHTGNWFTPPVCYIDREDKLWLGFDHGEWGGDLFVFDTHKRTFVPVQTEFNFELNPIDGFCEDQKNVYASGGLSHMSMTHGSVIKFEAGVGSAILVSQDRETPVKLELEDPKTGKKRIRTAITWTGGHQIGPIAYNPVNNCLYFYSQYGFYKGDLKTGLSDLKRWENILKPNLRWTAGRSNAVGSSINVLKMQFTTDGTLFFLAEYEGLGVYDGKDLSFLH
jgi:hypothetical protein